MRRKDREITNQEELMKIIAKCDTCRIALNDPSGFPYIIPLNFGESIEDGVLYLYFHSAKEGKKLDLIRNDPRVSFEMDCNHNIILYDKRMSCTMGYESVIGQGMIEFVEEEEKKLEACKILMRHFHDEEFPFNPKMLPVTEVYRLKVSNMVGKRRDNIHPEETSKKHITLE